jgi:hypothetical protein
MAQETLVKDQIDAGWNVALQFIRDVAPVDAAFWARSSDAGDWFLYIVSPAVDTKGRAVVYQAVSAMLKKLPSFSNLQFKIKLMNPADPAAEAVRIYRDDLHRAELSLFSDSGLGHIGVDAFYIYPKISPPSQGKLPMTHDEVKKAIFDLLDRSGHIQPSTVTLQDGSSFQGVPFGIEVSSNVMNVKFVDEASHLPRFVLVDQIASIY